VLTVELRSFILYLGIAYYLLRAVKSRGIHVVNELLVVVSYVGMPSVPGTSTRPPIIPFF